MRKDVYMFRVIIAGSRNFNDYYMLRDYVDYCLSRKVAEGEEIVILSGHCRGADLLAERFTAERKYRLEIYQAEWSRYGQAAGIRRNKQMVDVADAAILFWDGSSRGTLSTINFAREKGIPVRIKQYK